MKPFSHDRPEGTRREFLYAVSALALTQAVKPGTPSALKTFGIAYTSFPVRSRQAGQGGEGPAIPAENISTCASRLAVMAVRWPFHSWFLRMKTTLNGSVVRWKTRACSWNFRWRKSSG